MLLTTSVRLHHKTFQIVYRASIQTRTFNPNLSNNRCFRRSMSMGSSTEGDTDHYAAIIVGSGQGGTPLATAYAKAGHKTLLVEAAHIGGSEFIFHYSRQE